MPSISDQLCLSHSGGFQRLQHVIKTPGELSQFVITHHGNGTQIVRLRHILGCLLQAHHWAQSRRGHHGACGNGNKHAQRTNNQQHRTQRTDQLVGAFEVPRENQRGTNFIAQRQNTLIAAVVGRHVQLPAQHSSLIIRNRQIIAYSPRCARREVCHTHVGVVSLECLNLSRGTQQKTWVETVLQKCGSFFL